MPPKRPAPMESMAAVERAVQDTVRRTLPGLTTVVKWGLPWQRRNDLVLVVGAFSHHVGVEFWRGVELPDPAGLVEGTGKRLRHVKVRTVAEARAPAFRALLRAAGALDGATGAAPPVPARRYTRGRASRQGPKGGRKR